MLRNPILLLVILATAGPAGALDVNDPPMGVFSDEWYAVMMTDPATGKPAKSGHMHSTMERVKRGGQDLIRTRNEMTMVAGRGKMQITVSMVQTTEETLAGEPLRFTNKQTLAKVPTSTEGTFSKGKVRIVEKQLGFPTSAQTYDLPEGARMTWGSYREQIEQGLEPGSKYRLSVYEPSLAPDRLITADVEVLNREEIDLFGRKVQAVKTRQVMRLPGPAGEMNVATLIWLTGEGEALKLRMSLMGIDVDLLSCAKAVALAKNDPADLMGGTLIRVDRPLDRDVERLTLRLEWESDRPSLPETDMQKIARQDEKSVTLVNTRDSARRGKNAVAGRPLSDEDKARYLASSATLNYKDPEVARLARQAAGDEKDPRKLADKLRAFVGEYVQTKNLSVGFATASEVARSKEGDCSEHGVLLAALGRAVGIPTRLATGYVYAGEFLGREDVFVGHLWTQFYIDGQWLDVDAALHQTDVDPTHITFALSEGGNTGIADLIGSVWMAPKPKINVIDQDASEK